ncbi:MAG: hypothetical protein WKF37_10580 [Bryobacteraceae bacterium]
MSPDGKLVAYSSNRSPEGERDLYVKQIPGGHPIRLTFDGAGNTTPDFSPDGSKIVFRSNRDGGGIYEIPALGGDARLLARGGLNPRVSPDGSQVAFWLGGGNVAAAVPGSGSVWVVSAAGGPPQRVGSSFTSARYPIWSPDGKHLLFIGYTSTKPYDSTSIDWWLLANEGGRAVRTGAYEALVRAGVQGRDFTDNPSSPIPVPNVPRPLCWLAATNSVIFSTRSGDTSNLWETGISPGTGKVSGVFKRYRGSRKRSGTSCASGDALTFANANTSTDIWLQPFDLNRAKAKGAPQRITQGLPSRNTSRFPAMAAISPSFPIGRAG